VVTTEAPPITNVVRARSETEAAWMLAEAREGTRLVAGGTDLMLQVERGRLKPAALIDIRRAGMDKIELQDGMLTIGATTTATQLWRSDVVKQYARGLWEAAATLSAPTIRNMATLGGNLCNASPAADMVPCVLSMGGLVTARKGDQVRRIPAEELAPGPGRTVLAADELLTGIVLPRWSDDAFHHFVKLGFRDAQIIAVCSLSLSIELGDDAVVKRVGLALGSVAPKVVRAHHVEEMLLGTKLTRESAREAVALLTKDISPIDDIRSTAAHRRQVCANYLADGLARAYAARFAVTDAQRAMLAEPSPRPPEVAHERFDALSSIKANATGELSVRRTGPLSWKPAPKVKAARPAKKRR
jgi:CO/xanthine dehydrogenase FAD-binding subunit